MDYSKMFQKDESPTKYDKEIYDTNSYDSFIWSLQWNFLKKLILSLKQNFSINHLDFACGTGRVIGQAQSLIANSTGIDISNSMIQMAKHKFPKCNFLVGDILKNPEIIGQDYNFITAFRFFLNAEPNLRQQTIKSLASRLKDRESIFVFNIHGHKRSLRTFSKFFHSKDVLFNEMSYSEIISLTEFAGLDIMNVVGFGLFPRSLYASPIRPFLVRIEKKVSNSRLAQKFCSDLIFVCKLSPKTHFKE